MAPRVPEGYRFDVDQVSVLLVDDNVEFLDSAAAFLAADPRVRIVGRAAGGMEGVRLAAELKPDLVLIDLVMPLVSGLFATRLIKAAPSPPQVVVVTLHEGAEYERSAREALADGFLGKSRFTDDVTGIVESLLAARRGMP